MNPALKFLIRAVMGLVGAYFLLRVFLRSDSIGWWLALSALLVALAYVMESGRKKNN